MKIGQNKFVSVIYKLRLNSADGELAEETNKENPLKFVYGTGRMIKKFELNLEGLEAGNEFNFMISAKDAYGEYNKENVTDLPKDLFKVNGKIDEKLITIGNQIPMQDENGYRFIGVVLQVDENTVKMDFNHLLAGQDLFFSGSVLEVREATKEEMATSCAKSCSSGCSRGCG